MKINGRHSQNMPPTNFVNMLTKGVTRMRLIHSNIVLIEETDTIETIQNWIVANTDVVAVNLNLDEWVHTITPGDLILFNSSFAMFRFPANIVNNQQESKEEF